MPLLKPEASKWHFSVKLACAIALIFLVCLGGKQLEFEKIFHNLAFKSMDALRKKIHHLADFASNYSSVPHIRNMNLRNTRPQFSK